MGHSLINLRDSSRCQTQCPQPFHCISNFQISGINKTSAANEYIWGLQSWNLSNFREKATQHKSVLIKPQDKLLVCNGQPVFLVILEEILKYHWKTKCNEKSLSWNMNWIRRNGASGRRWNAWRGWQWWNSPMRFPGARHESSIRSMRKGDSLSGVSLSPILIPSPTLGSTIFGSPAPAVREEHPWGLPDRFIGVLVRNVDGELKNESKLHVTERWQITLVQSASLGLAKLQEIKQKKTKNPKKPKKNQSSLCFYISRRAPHRTAPTAQTH